MAYDNIRRALGGVVKEVAPPERAIMTQTNDQPLKLRYRREFDKAPAIRWHIDGILPLGGVTVLHGPTQKLQDIHSPRDGLVVRERFTVAGI
jgi:hypothetical protein